MEIDLRRFSLMNKYCSMDENVLECNKAAALTHIKVSDLILISLQRHRNHQVIN